MTTKGYHAIEGEYRRGEPPVLGKVLTIEALKRVKEGAAVAYHAHAGDDLLPSFSAARTRPDRLVIDRRGRIIGTLLESQHEDPNVHVTEPEKHGIAFNFIIEVHLDTSAAKIRRGNVPGSTYRKKSQPLPAWLYEHPVPHRRGGK